MSADGFMPCQSEYDFVVQRRYRGVSWQALADMTGRSIPALRVDYDPTFAKPAKVAPRPPRKGKKASRRQVAYTRRPNLTERVLRALYRANLPLHKTDFGGQPGVNKVSDLRKEYGADIVGSRQGAGYWLTPKGRALAEQLFPSLVETAP